MTATSPRPTFTNVYRTGGTAMCEWRRCLPVATREKANQQRAEVERMGYKTLTFKTHELDSIGMPEGWDA